MAISRCPLFLLFVSSATVIGDAAGDFQVIEASNDLLVEEFECIEDGKFLINGSCFDYIVCREVSTHFIKYRMPCIVGKVFDNKTKTCLDSSAVTSRPDCINEDDSLNTSAAVIVTTSSSLVSDDDSSEVSSTEATPSLTEKSLNIIHKMILNITSSSHEFCEYINDVNTYIDKVRAGLPIELKYSRDTQHNESISKYNEALDNIRNHVRVWSDGDDILTTIRRTFYKAKGYETSLDRKTGINKGRIQQKMDDLSNNNEITELKESINDLKIEISEFREYVKESPALLPMLERTKRRLKRKQQELKKKSGLGPVFEELTYFLKMVNNDAIEVKNKAKESSSRMRDWRLNLFIGTVDLKMYAIQVDRVLEKFEEDGEELKTVLAHYQKEKRELIAERESLRDLLPIIDRQLEAIIQKEKDALTAIKEKEQEHEKEQRKVCDTEGDYKVYFQNASSPFEFVCHYIKSLFATPLDLSEEYAAQEQLHNETLQQQEQLFEKMLMIYQQMRVIQNDITLKENDIEECRHKIIQNGMEINNLRFHSDYNAELSTAEQSALSGSRVLESGIEEISNTFHSIYKFIDGLVARSTAAQTVTNIKDATKVKESIEQQLSELQQNIDGSSENIDNIANCHYNDN